jgi:hypothetical protein
MPHKQPGLDGRHRDNNGEIHEKRGDTLLRTLRETYPGLLPGTRADTRLDTLRERHGVESLDQLLRQQGHKK